MAALTTLNITEKNDDNGVSMMHYIDYEDIIGVELIKN